MNIVLVGYRGTGKSSVARRVAELTGRGTFSMDSEIERKTGNSISDYVTRHGWEPFRDLESEVAKIAGACDETVIDTGGGAVLRAENVRVLKANGKMVWLQADPETIARRIEGVADRPSLTGNKSYLEEIEEVLEERSPVYASVADLTIRTGGRSIDNIAQEIAKAFPGKHLP